MEGSLAPGLLLAAPVITEEPFARSVILLARHDEEGALGVIINRALPTSLGELLPGLGEGFDDHPVLHGGPVAPHIAWLLHEGAMSESEEGVYSAGDDLVLTVRRDHLEGILSDDRPGNMHLFLGHSGWGPGQLDDEFARGVWIHADLELDLVFGAPFEERWSQALRRNGINPAFLGQGGFLA